jgi:hypothetical protein
MFWQQLSHVLSKVFRPCFHVFCAVWYSALKAEAVFVYEMSVYCYQTTWRHIPEYSRSTVAAWELRSFHWDISCCTYLSYIKWHFPMTVVNYELLVRTDLSWTTDNCLNPLFLAFCALNEQNAWWFAQNSLHDSFSGDVPSGTPYLFCSQRNAARMADVWRPPSSQKPESSTLGICDVTKERNTLLHMYRPRKLNVLEHFDISRFFYSPTDAKVNCLKKNYILRYNLH